MSALDRVIPLPRLLERHHVDVAAQPEAAWPVVRHLDLGRSPLVRALFFMRTTDRAPLTVDALVSTPERPGFQLLVDDPPHAFAVGAIGQVWHLDIPFLHVPDADAFRAFVSPGFVKVAWAVRIDGLGQTGSRIEVEVRVDATDEPSWREFQRYFRVIGPASRLIRRVLLASLRRQLGSLEESDEERALPGDELLPDAGAQLTDALTLRATPEQIWPWLVQMGSRRAGFYSFDLLDNAGGRSARELHPELQHPSVGDVLPATPQGTDGFEVLRLEPPSTLILGGLYDPRAGQLRFDAARPERYWHVTWSFVLEPLDARSTRLHVRVRAAFSPRGRLHLAWIGPVHRLMEHAQLRHLAARVEGRLPRDDWHDVLEGVSGAARMAALLLSPVGRSGRSHWGLDAETAGREWPGDELVPEPRWQWTHAVEVDAPAEEVWPWVAQLGADRAGFYSYQWLENVAGCGVRNAETVHPECALKEGDSLVLHPKVPPLPIVESVPGRHLVAAAFADEAAKREGRPWVDASWAFFVEPLGPHRARVISRYRCATSGDLFTRLTMGRPLIEPIGFAMDRRMLLGIKERAERRAPRAVPPPPVVWATLGAVTSAVAAWALWTRPWRRSVPPSRALDAWIPGAQFRDTIAVKVKAPPDVVLDAFRKVGLAEMPLAWALGELRYLSDRLKGKARAVSPHASFVESLTASGTRVLDQRPGREVVFGSVGKLHRIRDQSFVALRNADDFLRFDAPGHEKLAMSVRIEDADSHGCTAVLEHRTLALDGKSKRRFALYWLAIKPGGASSPGNSCAPPAAARRPRRTIRAPQSEAAVSPARSGRPPRGPGRRSERCPNPSCPTPRWCGGTPGSRRAAVHRGRPRPRGSCRCRDRPRVRPPRPDSPANRCLPSSGP